MSDEEKALMARISQVAGQINRHKNQQTAQRQSPNHHPVHYRHNTYRHAGSPYSTRGGHRVGRPPATYQNRTLQLNSGAGQTGSRSSGNGAGTPAGFVARNDRHRQLINADVYEKDSQNRARAIEETRQRIMSGHRQREKTNFKEYLKNQAASRGAANPAARNEIVVDGVHFRVMDGGKKLVKIAGAPNSSSHTPKSTIVAGVKFHRTKTGNLVAERVVTDQRRSGTVKKTNEPCKIFSTTGSCPKGPRCRYLHDPHKVALCKDFLKEGRCANGEFCDLSHELTSERIPNCVHFAKGNCTKSDCPYTHSKASPSAPVCRCFGFNGYCEKGAGCAERHVFECPDFSNTGRCKVKGCKLLHRERASVLRSQALADAAMEDLSSGDEGGDSDDVDSDEVAEFLEADSDASDFGDEAKDFLSI